MRGSVGAWLAWVIMEGCFDELDAPSRGSRARTFPSVQPPLEAFATPGARTSSTRSDGS